VLITRQARRRAYNVPVLLFLFGSVFLIFSMAALVNVARLGDGFAMVFGLLLGAWAIAMSLGEIRVLRSVDDLVSVRGWRRTLTLDRASTAFGVRLQTSFRSSRYIVLITDGSVSDDVTECLSEGRARRAIARLEAALGTEPGRRAAAFVRSIEKPWQANVAEGQKIIDAYYASPAWRRAKYGVLGLVVIYSLAMLLYGAVWG
jgi:hypothetical protein